MNLITQAKRSIGTCALATACGFKNHRSIGQMEERGLPMTDLTGETNYSSIIEELSAGKVTRYDLLCSRLSDMVPGITYKLPATLFRADQDQPRKVFPNEHIASIAAAILTDGQETAIKIKYQPATGKPPLLITHGECRWRAVLSVEFPTIDCILDATDDSPPNRKLRQAADNNGRPLSQWDWVCLFTTLHDKHKMGDSVIEYELKNRGINNFSRSKIANLRRLITLPIELQQMIATDWLSPSHGKYLLQIKHHEVMSTIIDELMHLNDSNESSPTITKLLVMMRDTYIKTPTIKRIMTHGNGGSILRCLTDFNPTIECDCTNIYSLTQTDGLTDLFCGDLDCWQKKQNEANATENSDDEPTETPQDEQEPVKTADHKTPTKTPDQQVAEKQHKMKGTPTKQTPTAQQWMCRTVNISAGDYTLTNYNKEALWLAHKNGSGMPISNDAFMTMLDQHFREYF